MATEWLLLVLISQCTGHHAPVIEHPEIFAKQTGQPLKVFWKIGWMNQKLILINIPIKLLVILIALLMMLPRVSSLVVHRFISVFGMTTLQGLKGIVTNLDTKHRKQRIPRLGLNREGVMRH